MGTAMPTLSQIRGWDVEHLHAAATHWTARATSWEQAYTAAHQQVQRAGGQPWEGRAADAAYERVGSDRVVAVNAADVLHAVAAVARTGAEDVHTARRRALAVIDAARRDGFDVTDDLSIDDRIVSPTPAADAARHAQALAHATAIWGAAEHLALTDASVGTQIGTAAADLHRARFAGGSTPASPDDVIVGDGTPVPGIRLVVDETGGPLPQQPSPAPPPPTPTPPITGEPIRLPPRTTAPPMPVIDLGIQPESPGRAGFPRCGTEDVLKAWASIVAGGTLAGVSVPGEAVTAGVATAGIMGGAILMWDGIDTLEKCK